MTGTSPELMTGLGAAAAMFLCSAGSGLASAHAGLYALRASGVTSFVPIIVSGVLAIYGIIVAVILSGKFGSALTSEEGYKNFSAGLAVGVACLCSGLGMAKFMDMFIQNHKSSSERIHESEGEQPLLGRAGLTTTLPPVGWKFFFVLTFLEAIGLYGLIVALILSN